MKSKIIAGVGICLLCVSCASKPSKIPAQYVSPLIYKDYNCDQIALEMDRVSHRSNDLYFSLKKEASNDAVQMGVGLVLFWPTLFFLEGGDGPEAAEYARLRGEYEALHKCAVQEKCSLGALPPSPEKLIKQEKEKRQEAMAKKEEEERSQFD